ncbi:hypothetical protein DIPPA_01154 [Diplonema papillatum]|nr:hypothetical protein DIPPA_01154 [Diplonema papillatum]
MISLAPELTADGFRRALQNLHDDLVDLEDERDSRTDVTAETACRVLQNLELKVQALRTCPSPARM